jgi:two-component system cell cycle response regulator
MVDDCVEQRDLYEIALGADFEIVTAGRGAEALEMVRDLMPNAIVLDMMMPGMSGIEVCRYLKADPATESIPIIVLTAIDDRQMQRECLEAGAADVLLKPCTPDRLLQRIVAMCGKV